MNKNTKKTQFSLGNILVTTVCILFALIALTAWAVSGVYAKFVDSAAMNESADVARVGVETLMFREHEAKRYAEDEIFEKGTIYYLDKESAPIGGTTISMITYDRVLPGVNIAKDLWIDLKITQCEVKYELYLKITKAVVGDDKNTLDFLQLDTDLADEWTATSTAGLYKYSTAFAAGTSHTYLYDASGAASNEIHVFEKDRLRVNEKYNGESFTLTFEVYLQQTIE